MRSKRVVRVRIPAASSFSSVLSQKRVKVVDIPSVDDSALPPVRTKLSSLEFFQRSRVWAASAPDASESANTAAGTTLAIRRTAWPGRALRPIVSSVNRSSPFRRRSASSMARCVTGFAGAFPESPPRPYCSPKPFIPSRSPW